MKPIKPPEKAIVKTDRRGDEVYISSITTTHIIFRRIKDGTFYNTIFDPAIVELFKIIDSKPQKTVKRTNTRKK